MLQAFLKTALRRFGRHRAYFAINVVGLTLGMASCILIALWVRNELSFDRWFPDSEDIYRATVTRSFPNGTTRSAATPRPLAAALVRELPEVAQVSRISRERAERVLVSSGLNRGFEEGFFFADPNVFSVLGFRFTRGSSQTALEAGFSVVLSESASRRYFGNVDPMGRTITVRLQGSADFHAYNVTGVIEDAPDQTHIRPEFLATYRGHPLVGEEDDGRNWGGLNLYTYVTLVEGADATSVVEKIPAVVEKHMGPIVEEELGLSYAEFQRAGNRFEYDLQPLSGIHLTSDLANDAADTSPPLYVWVFAFVAAFILLLACFNFVNLATAIGLDRAKEVGVRKALGTSRLQLVALILTESMLISVVSGLAALWLARSVVPLFEGWSGKMLNVEIWTDPSTLAIGLTLVVAVGVLSGLYPAIHLSKLDPGPSLKGLVASSAHGGNAIRRGLVVVQFAIAIVLVTATLIVDRQLSFTAERPLGFDREHVVLIEGTEVLRERMEPFKDALRRNPDVVSVANTQTAPGARLDETDVRLDEAGEETAVTTSWMTTNAGFVETLGIEITDGRSFDPKLAGDSMAVLLNETAVHTLGLSEPLGSRIIHEDRRYEIIGVVRDYHFASLHQRIGPLVLFGPDPFNEARPNLQVAVRISGADLERALAFLTDTWGHFEPLQPMRYSLLDDVVDRAYRSERQTGRLISLFAGLAILIACLGLIGLASLIARRRTKEIGVRRALGASVTAVVVMLSTSFVRLVIVAFAIGAPIAYIGMRLWLDNFAYRTEITPGLFILAGLTVVSVAILSVGYQSLRAGLSDPIKSLRYE